MFTGIIEEIGEIKEIRHGEKSARLTVACSTVTEGSRVGDSIAVNGVCLTATNITTGSFTADVMAETIRRSSLGTLVPGSRVNLELAMPADGRFGGHIVSGHIDGTGTVTKLTKEDNAVWVTIRAEQPVLRLIVEKGSVAIDGISLTVAKVEADSFSVSVIPHTGSTTTLLEKKVGDKVNLENDVIGKYVERLLNLTSAQPERKSGINMDFLAEHDFL